MVSRNINKKKILFVITKAQFGGAQRYVYDLATRLPRERFDAIVAMGGKGVLAEKLKKEGVRTISLERLGRDISIRDDIAAFFDLLKLFRNEKPDVVHLNSSKIGGLGALAARLASVPTIVFTAHGWAWNEQRKAYQKVAIKFLSWITIMLCHRVIAVSEYDGEQGRTLPFARKKISIVHNGVSEIDTLEKTGARRALLGAYTTTLKDNAIWVGTIAELHKNKGLGYAIEAFKSAKEHIPQTEFVFVVVGEGEERTSLQKMISEKGLANTVFLVGHRKNAASLLKAFDIFLLPSVKEGLPYALLEAGMAGIPSIATVAGGTPEIVEDMETGILVQPRNPEEIRKALAYFAENPAQMKTFGKKLRKKVDGEFSTTRMLTETMQIYRV